MIRGVQLYFTDPSPRPADRDQLLRARSLEERGRPGSVCRGGEAKKSFGMFDKVNGTDASRKALQAGTAGGADRRVLEAGRGRVPGAAEEVSAVLNSGLVD